MTVLLHGLGGSVLETGALGAHLTGTRVLPHLRGHGASRALDGRWSWEALADDLEALVEHFAARRVVASSVGAGALLRLLARRPDLLRSAVVLAPVLLDRLPADVRSEHVAALVRALEDGREQDAARLLADEPRSPGGRDDLAGHAARAAWAASSDVARLMAGLHGSAPVDDAAALGAVTADVLVVAVQDDPLHLVAVARDVAAALPRARLEVLGAHEEASARERRLAALVADHLDGPAGRLRPRRAGEGPPVARTAVLVGGSRDGEQTPVAEGVRVVVAASAAPGLLDLYEASGDRVQVRGDSGQHGEVFRFAGQVPADGVAPDALHLPSAR